MKNRLLVGISAGIGMLLMILDAKTGVTAAGKGISLCFETVIPSLFPFIFLSSLLCSSFIGVRRRFLKPLSRFCGIPTGSETILILGLLGGYPVGAKNIASAYTQGALSKEASERMLGFCNNAGPSFLFGMLSVIFQDAKVLWSLWFVLILSALLTAFLLPNKAKGSVTLSEGKPLSVVQAVADSGKTMGIICCWVILFRIVIAFCNRWFLWLLRAKQQILFSGILELTNGCVGLSYLGNEAVRFLFATFFLTFGGLCVAMQTAAIVGDLSMKTYCRGKAVQVCISLLLASFAQSLLFPHAFVYIPGWIKLSLLCTVLLLSKKIPVAFWKNMRYNRKKSILR